jgi:hypothetical protein
MITVQSRELGVQTSGESIMMPLPGNTPSHVLWKIFAMAVRSRVTGFETSRDNSKIGMSVVIGNDTEQHSYQNTKHWFLENYPADDQGDIWCNVALSCIAIPPDEFVTLRLRDSTDTDQHVASLDVVQHARLLLPATEAPAPNNQHAQRLAKSKRRIRLDVDYLGLTHFNHSTTIKAPLNADFDQLEELFDQQIKTDTMPKWLHCLLFWRSSIGTESEGYADAQEGKTLAQYPGFNEPHTTAKITAAFFIPTIENLLRKESAFLTTTPKPEQATGWLQGLARVVGVEVEEGPARQNQNSMRRPIRYVEPKYSEKDLGNVAKECFNMAERQRARITADIYGHLVRDIYHGKV